MKLLDAPRQVVHLGVGIFDVVDRRRSELQRDLFGRISAVTKRGEGRLHHIRTNGVKPKAHKSGEHSRVMS